MIVAALYDNAWMPLESSDYQGLWWGNQKIKVTTRACKSFALFWYYWQGKQSRHEKALSPIKERGLLQGDGGFIVFRRLWLMRRKDTGILRACRLKRSCQRSLKRPWCSSVVVNIRDDKANNQKDYRYIWVNNVWMHDVICYVLLCYLLAILSIE